MRLDGLLGSLAQVALEGLGHLLEVILHFAVVLLLNFHSLLQWSNELYPQDIRECTSNTKKYDDCDAYLVGELGGLVLSLHCDLKNETDLKIEPKIRDDKAHYSLVSRNKTLEALAKL